MTTPDTSRLITVRDSLVAALGLLQREDGSVDSTLAKVDEAERRISRAHSEIVEYQCQARGQSRR